MHDLEHGYATRFELVSVTTPGTKQAMLSPSFMSTPIMPIYDGVALSRIPADPAGTHRPVVALRTLETMLILEMGGRYMGDERVDRLNNWLSRAFPLAPHIAAHARYYIEGTGLTSIPVSFNQTEESHAALVCEFLTAAKHSDGALADAVVLGNFQERPTTEPRMLAARSAKGFEADDGLAEELAGRGGGSTGLNKEMLVRYREAVKNQDDTAKAAALIGMPSALTSVDEAALHRLMTKSSVSTHKLEISHDIKLRKEFMDDVKQSEEDGAGGAAPAGGQQPAGSSDGTQ